MSSYPYSNCTFFFSLLHNVLALMHAKIWWKQVQREYHLPAGDFPDVEHFKEVLATYSIDKFEKVKPKMVQAVDDMLAHDIPDLLKNFSNPYQ